MSERKRVILIMPRDGGMEMSRALENALAQLTERGWLPVGIIDPANHLEALRMVIDGTADIVVALRPEYMPAMWFAGDLSAGDRTRPVDRSGGPRRTRPLDRPSNRPWREPSSRDDAAEVVSPMEGMAAYVASTIVDAEATGRRNLRTQVLKRPEPSNQHTVDGPPNERRVGPVRRGRSTRLDLTDAT